MESRFASILSRLGSKRNARKPVGIKDVMAVTSIAATLGLGRLISLPFAGPLSDKLETFFRDYWMLRILCSILSRIAFSPNTTIAYIAAVLGGITKLILRYSNVSCSSRDYL